MLHNSISGPTVNSDVPKTIRDLEETFNSLLDDLELELSSGNHSVEKFLSALTRLPYAFRVEYEGAIQKKLPRLQKQKTIPELFLHLNPLFTFIDYELLEYLISKFGSSRLKDEMQSYIKRVQFFKKTKTVGELIKCWPVRRAHGANFTELKLKFGDDPQDYTLENLDEFRRRFYAEIRLSHFISVSIFLSVEASRSFFVMWLLPSAVASKISNAVNKIKSRFYLAHHITQVSLSEVLLYPNSTSSMEDIICVPTGPTRIEDNMSICDSQVS